MLSVAVMAHPSRAAFVEDLTSQLPPETCVVWDQHNDRWDTGRRSLLAFDPDAEAHLVIQDDALICPDIILGAELVAQPDRPVCLYTGKVRPDARTVTPALRFARRTGAPWIAMPGPRWGVGIILPTAHIPEIVEWGDTHPRIENYDSRIGGYYRERDIDCWYTVPSLVDHRPVDENPSLIPQRTGNRQAHWFIGDNDPAGIDWSVPPVLVGESVTFHNAGSGQARKVRAFSSRHLRMERHPAWSET